ncbi:MAG: hypothetical protein AB7F59_07315 [Bdellovibrionales bacterium]
MRVSYILGFLSVLLTSFSIFATERYEFFTGVRQNGMGGAGVAAVNDETALLTNPALLAKLRGYIFTIADPELSAGSENLSIYGNNTPSSVMEPQGLLTAVTQQPNKHWHAKAQLLPSFVISNFGFGVFYKQEWNAELVSSTPTSATPRYLLDYTYDTGFVLGYSLRLFDGRLKIGMAGRYINHVITRSDLDPSATGLTLGDLVSEGGGIAGDGGIVLAAPWTFLPTIAASIHDIGHTRYDLNGGLFYKNGRRPHDTPQTIDVGVALFPIHSNHVRSVFTVDYRDVTTAGEETDIMRRLHGGVEVNLGDMIFLRGGMNQRYWTAGFEFSMRLIQIQMATYGEEIGTATAYREDRRYTSKLSIRF